MRVQRFLPTPADGVAVDPTVPRTLAYEPALDGLRGISIAAVALFHACATSGLGDWFRGGALGVSVFFTLSGFLITTVLLREVGDRGRVDLRRFWSRRIRRLAPASLVVVAAVVVLGRTSLFDIAPREAAATIWSFANWNVVASGDAGLLRTIVGPLGPTWSLAVEEQFYIALAVVVLLCTKARRTERWLAGVFAVVIVASVVLANVVSDWHPRLEFGTDVRAGELAAGGLLALAVGRWGPILRERVRALDVAGAVALAALGVLIMSADYTPPWLLRGGFAVVALVSVSLVASALAHGRVEAVLAWDPLVRVGRWSYSIYLVHWPVILAMTEERIGVDGWALVALKLIVAVAIGVIIHVLVEQPVRRIQRGLAVTVGAWLTASAAVTGLAFALA